MESKPPHDGSKGPVEMKQNILRFKGLRGLGFRVFRVQGSGFRA